MSLNFIGSAKFFYASKVQGFEASLQKLEQRSLGNVFLRKEGGGFM